MVLDVVVVDISKTSGHLECASVTVTHKALLQQRTFCLETDPRSQHECVPMVKKPRAMGARGPWLVHSLKTGKLNKI